jgi:hypothetical protein
LLGVKLKAQEKKQKAEGGEQRAMGIENGDRRKETGKRSRGRRGEGTPGP